MNEWKEAIMDALLASQIYSPEHENNPRKALQDAIEWNVKIALDPAVSSEAATFERLQSLVIQWAQDRKIIPNSTPDAQWVKLREEMDELWRGIILHLSDKGSEELIDALGDCTVVLVNIAALSGLDLVDCLAHAYDQIKERKGYLREDGIFVKEEAIAKARGE